MKKLLIIILVTAVSTGCGDSNTSNSDLKHSKEQTINEDLVEEELIELDSDKLLKSEREEHKIRMEKKGFNFTCINNCGKGAASEENVLKQRRRIPFNVSNSKSDSLIIVEFSFIDDCCKEFTGDIELTQNEIALPYKNISGIGCDCYCEYQYRFEIKHETHTSNFITLNGRAI